MTTTTHDPYHIVPRNVTHAAVKSFDFQVRTMVDYDVNFLQDRVRSEIFVNGTYCGVYAAAKVDDSFARDSDLRRAMEFYGPELERMVVDEFMGLGYRKRVRALEDEVRALKAHINRPRWWQFRPLRREVRNLRSRIAAALAPKGSDENPMENEVQ